MLKNSKINLFLQNKTKASFNFLQTKNSNYFDSNCVKIKTYRFLLQVKKLLIYLLKKGYRGPGFKF